MSATISWRNVRNLKKENEFFREKPVSRRGKMLYQNKIRARKISSPKLQSSWVLFSTPVYLCHCFITSTDSFQMQRQNPYP